ncbi:dockerin type I domain-containing protein [Mucisphaera calidilacus]|uniref:Dockerin domain-containing protein n=1 Tax=Mucisphaera calidilacus TaxID=2527982 RepID=A0A518BUL6_9BACT|nr:dockerin type I domain-containing protein [Mucisphaera calidilacus]QDU70683.1 hypothetical protein Pan265_05130 [Mucisphaera calidilacus]
MRTPSRSRLTTLLAGLALAAPAIASSDLAVVPLWDGETLETLTNRFGGNPLAYNLDLDRTTTTRYAGQAGYVIKTEGTLAQNDWGFIQAPLAAYGPAGEFATSRDLTPYASVDFALRNDTGEPFTIQFEIKDYRDGNGHIARMPLTIDAGRSWQQISIPLDLNDPGWQRTGIPAGTEHDFLDRTKSLGMVVQANQGTAVDGSIYFDEMVLREPGGPVDVATAPINQVAERLAKRQWQAIWGSRNRVNGLMPLHSTNAGHGAINVTAAMALMLPRAVDNGWVPQHEADAYMTTLADSFNTIMDQATHAPGRYFNWQTLANDLVPEETNIDTAFLALAMHRYSSRESTPDDLRNELDDLRNRFDFAAFSDTTGPNTGWSLAYNTNTQQMLGGTYNGYGGENWVISLAAHLNDDFHVDITEQYHSSVHREHDFLVDPDKAHLVNSSEQFRPPFVQWLLPLFVDTSDRGDDTYPIASLAGNPNRNAELYQQDVDAYFAAINRAFFLQPDAGANTSDGPYAQYSAYDDHGYPDLFMPWSAAFALLGDEPAGEAAIRFLLENDLEGPFGLSDAARWTTNAALPSEVRGFYDLWNTTLSTMALFEYLWNDAADYANVPEVADALDKVFNPLIAGDFTRDNLINADDIDRLSARLGLTATQAGPMYDLDNDGSIDAIDHAILVASLVETDLGPGTGTLVGDANLSGTVDLLDLSILAASFEQAGGWAQGDNNGDGIIDLIDLSRLATAFGQSINLPEPAAACPLTLGLFLTHRRQANA